MAAEEKANGLSLGIGIEYSWTVQQLSESGGVPDDTYFYDFTTKLVYYKNASGVTLEIFGESGTGSGTDSDAIHKNVNSEISTIDEKTSLEADDIFIIEDSTSTPVNSKKRTTLDDIKTFVNTGSGGGGGGATAIDAFPISSGTTGTVNGWNTLNAITVLPSHNIAVDKISYYVMNVGTGNRWVKVGIYQKSNLLLKASGITSNGSAAGTGINTIDLTESFTMLKGVEYYLALWCQDNSVNFLGKSVIAGPTASQAFCRQQASLSRLEFQDLPGTIPGTPHSTGVWLRAHS